MPHIRLQAVDGQDHVSLLLEPCLDALLIQDAQGHQFFIALHQMRNFSLRDRQTTGKQALMHLWDTAVLCEPPEANQGNDIQAKFAMGQRPASFLFGMISHVIERAGGGGTLIHDHPEPASDPPRSSPSVGSDTPPTIGFRIAHSSSEAASGWW